MASPVVESNGNVDIAIDVKWFGQTLREDIDDVVVAVGAVMELDAKCALPFLGLQDVFCIGGMKEKTFKLDLTHPRYPRTGFQSGIDVIAEAVVALQKAHLWIKVRAYCAVLGEEIQPIALVTETGSPVGLP